MDQAVDPKLTPRYVDGKPMVLAGMSERVTFDAWDKIDKLWWRFAPHIGKVPAQVGARVAYGVVSGADNAIDYMASVEVTDRIHIQVGADYLSVWAAVDETTWKVWPARPNIPYAFRDLQQALLEDPAGVP